MNMQAEIDRLKRENEALKKLADDAWKLKVSEKGAMSIYGMGRFPVTLYKEQWLKILDRADEVREFIKDNDRKLKSKGE